MAKCLSGEERYYACFHITFITLTPNGLKQMAKQYLDVNGIAVLQLSFPFLVPLYYLG